MKENTVMKSGNDPGLLKYQDFALSNTVEEILKEDFFLFRGYNAAMFAYSKGPVKFSAYASLYLRKGWGRVQLSLREIVVKAPAVISIREGEILQTLECSDDLDVSFCVMSKRFVESLFGMIADVSTMTMLQRSSIFPIPEDLVGEYEEFYDVVDKVIRQPGIPKRFHAVLHTVLAFYYRSGHRVFDAKTEKRTDAAARLTESFLYLVNRNFREQRFLDFYADALGITRKHLSRVIKQETGLSPVDWIERNVILEAKVLLKSSTLTIQQISDTLNFSSQSFFGKHFKQHTGYTPGEFRNM